MANTIEQSNQLAQSICSVNSGYLYLYGAKDESYTTELVNRLSKMYSDKIDRADALKHADMGNMAIDCSGFICKTLGIPDIGSYQLESTAVKKLGVNRANARPGMVLWKSGHVAYVGDNLTVYEAASQKSGMKKSTFESRAVAFQELLIVKGSALADTPVDPGIGNPYPVPSRTIMYRKGSSVMAGEDVKWVQYNLEKAGYNVELDGRFGPACDKALREFQTACGIPADGKCGPDTREHLMKV